MTEYRIKSEETGYALYKGPTMTGLIDKLEAWLCVRGFCVYLESVGKDGIDIAFLDNDSNVAASILVEEGNDFGLCLEEAAEEALEWWKEAKP